MATMKTTPSARTVNTTENGNVLRANTAREVRVARRRHASSTRSRRQLGAESRMRIIPCDAVLASRVNIVEATLDLFVAEVVFAPESLWKGAPELVRQLGALLRLEPFGEGENLSHAFGSHARGS
jgi:hypothetical protein